MRKYLSPIIESSANNEWCSFAEDEVKLKSCNLFGVSWFGFASYGNNITVRSYVEVGRYCSIGRDVILGLGHHDYTNISTSPYFEKVGFNNNKIKLACENPKRRVIIGNDVWIGDKAMVVSGVSVGDGCVIAAGSVVTKDVPPYSIVAGVPAKVIKNRFPDEVISELIDIKYWAYDPVEVQLIMQYSISVEDFLQKFKDNKKSIGYFSANHKKIVP
ncbi:CatB-related O-acetyltransferase [Comamonas testosteroni]|uniref:CatB-related O-acetyltransferase n=1 Tax=Comamonas testosteroni TaxID=285 RepID=UPI002E0E8247|nr:CatB-related O-acetyltransferase [Comamonas testosteroni]